MSGRFFIALQGLLKKGAFTPWPPLRGGSARRRWGREPCGGQEYFGSWLAKNLIGLLRPYGWFVGNGLDRSVPPCQKYDTAGKPRATGCADGSRPIPTNILKPLTRQTSAGAYRMRPYGFRFRSNAPSPLAPSAGGGLRPQAVGERSVRRAGIFWVQTGEKLL